MCDSGYTNVREGLESEDLPPQVQNRSQWMDCTSFLSTVCSTMDIGEILHHRTKFSLLEVMSAIEMMDPKMDSSFNTPRVCSVAERYMDGYLPPFEKLSLRQMIYTMDRLFAAEMQWYDGSSLPQTVFSCLYLHDDLCFLRANKDTPKTSIFLLFTKTLFHRLDEVVGLMFKSECRTDEEFVNNTFGMFNVKNIESPNEVLAQLDRLERDLMDRIKGKPNVFPPLQDDPREEVTYVQALLSRIRFQRLFFRTHYLLSDPMRADLQQALKTVKAAIDEYKIVQRQHAELFSEEEEDLSIAFDPKITIRVSSASVLKPLDPPSFAESSKLMESYLNHISLICTVKRQASGSLSQLLKFFNEFSNITDTTVVARSRLMHVVMVEGKLFGLLAMRDLVLKHVQTELPMLNENHRQMFRAVSGAIALATQDDENTEHDTNLWRDCDDWLSMMSNCFSSYLNILCSNPSTHRRKLAHLITEWGACEQRAEMLDLSCIDELRERKQKGEEGFNVSGKEHLFALTYFCIELTMDCIYQYLMIGFDLQLYHRTEIHHIYWYLDYISGLRVQNMGKMLQKVLTVGSASGAVKKKKKNKKNKNTESKVPSQGKLVPVEPSPDQRVLRATLEVDSLMSRALCRFIHALLISLSEHGIENLFDDKTLANFDPKLRFERRFQSFYTIAQPPPVFYDSYNQHLRLMLRDLTATKLLEAATDHFSAAKRLIDASLVQMESILSDYQTEELKALSKVAQANLISVMMVTMRIKQVPMPLPLMDFSFSSRYPVIKLPSGSTSISTKK